MAADSTITQPPMRRDDLKHLKLKEPGPMALFFSKATLLDLLVDFLSPSFFHILIYEMWKKLVSGKCKCLMNGVQQWLSSFSMTLVSEVLFPFINIVNYVMESKHVYNIKIQNT